MSETESGPWYKEAFTELYSEVYGHRDRREAEAAISLLMRHVTVRGSMVLDLACGSGRHMGALADAGARPVGLDLSPPLLRGARLSGQGNLLQGDMRVLPFRSKVFDGAISMFTSFGYFSDHKEEMSVLLEVARCLKEKGWFVLDYMNSVLVRSTLEPRSRKKVGRLDVVELRRVDSTQERVTKEVKIFAGGSLLKEFTEEVRLLSREKISAMLTDAGLRPCLVLGDYSGGPFVESRSSRLITFCVRA